MMTNIHENTMNKNAMPSESSTLIGAVASYVMGTMSTDIIIMVKALTTSSCHGDKLPMSTDMLRLEKRTSYTCRDVKETPPTHHRSKSHRWYTADAIDDVSSITITIIAMP